jgi:glycosyltransferase involved in cell wall biosynthesis
MRLGVDLHAIQAPSCRNRGIGRYAQSLLHALPTVAPSWKLVFYRRADLELDSDPLLDDRVDEWVTVEPDPVGQADGTLQQIVQRNPQRLDWLLIPNPLIDRRLFAIPEPVPGGPRLAAVVHDLIPALYPNHYLPDARLGLEYLRETRRLQAYDLLLCNSEATRRDHHRQLAIPERRLVNIRAGADPGFFGPAAADEETARADRRVLSDLGIQEPFFYYLGNIDWRKNILGLIDVFALLPEDLRQSHLLVLTFQDNAWFLNSLRRRIEQCGLHDRVVLTGPLTDVEVRALYRRAELFLFPSLYEGFGLPIVEAMQCGAVVVAADNSAQPEVVGSAGVLAETGNPADWARKIVDLIHDPARCAALREASLEQAKQFSWEASARTLCAALEGAGPRRLRRQTVPVTLIPCPSGGDRGFGSSGVELFNALCDRLEPQVFYDTERIAALPPCPLWARWHDKRLLGRIRGVAGASPVLYVVDTVDALAPLIDDLQAYPGVISFCNPRIAAWSHLVPRPDDEIRGASPAAASEVEAGLSQVLRRATAVVCHSEWMVQRLTDLAGHSRTTPVHHVGSVAGSSREQASFYGALLRAS